MKLLKPTWVSHDGQPIFSVDIHPDGSRFATGGQGDSSGTGKIVIWNMEPVREEVHEKDPNVPKILCQMDHHLACVNCVRWSGDGKYLASAGDDKLIMIWQASRQTGVSSNFGSGGKSSNAESWRIFSTLRGHSGDVLAVAWSSHDAWLASCSVDNTIIVWNALKFPEQIACLRGHTGMVKGITWDPVGKYLASQSDDKTVRIWRTYDWQPESCIKEPFAECSGTTQVLRLDWSPDGEYVVSAHAMNNSGPTAQIIDREGWRSNIDFVGHRKAVTCVRFSSRIMERVHLKGAAKSQCVACAIGSRDRSISVWLTCFKRPLVVLHDLFQQSILDITWSGDGMEMMCCSLDGTVAFFGFPVEEIGTALSHQQKAAIHKKLYGKSVLMEEPGANNVIVESFEMLEAHENRKVKAAQVDFNVGKMPEKNSSAGMEFDPSKSEHSASGGSPVKPANRQIETRTKDGKRKITPIFLAPQPDFEGVPMPYTSFQHQTTPQFSSSTETSTIIVEKNEASPFKPPKSRENSSSQSEAAQPPKPQEVRAATPTTAIPATATPATAMDAQPVTQHDNQNSAPAEVNFPATSHNHSEVLEATTANKLPVQVNTPLNESHTRVHAHDGTEELKKKKDGRGRPRKDRLPDVSTKTQNHTSAQAVPTTPVSNAIHPGFPTDSGPKAFSLPGLANLANPFTCRIPKTTDDDATYMAEVSQKKPRELTMLKCYKGSSLVWQIPADSSVVAASASSAIFAVMCGDRRVYVYSTPTGQQMFWFIHLGDRPSIFQSSSSHLMIVTTSGELSVWDISPAKPVECLLRNESIARLFDGEGGHIEQTWITKQGMPLLLLSNHSAYSYCKAGKCWKPLSSASDAIATIADCEPIRNDGEFLSRLAFKPRPGDKATKMYDSNQASRVAATICHLERQVMSSLALQSLSDLKTWLKPYAKWLVLNGDELRLRSLCQDLVAPLYTSSFSSSSVASLLGHECLEVFQEILDMMKNCTALQRLHNEFQSQVDAAASSADAMM